jgi:hypothetical protein
MTLAEDLEEELGAGLGKRHIAEFVDDEQFEAASWAWSLKRRPSSRASMNIRGHPSCVPPRGRYRPARHPGGCLASARRSRLPAQHNLEAYLDSYLEAAGIRDAGKAPLFRSAVGRTGTLTDNAMNRVDAWRMVQRRAGGLGMRAKIGCHTFRATGITAYLEAGGTLENAQAMAAHESPRTTKLYDRTGDEITLDEVERITI